MGQIEALCEIYSASRQPLCINGSTVEQLNLPPLAAAARGGIVSGLGRKDIKCCEQQVLSGGDAIATGFLIWRRGETLKSAAVVENIIGIISDPLGNYARRSASVGDVNLRTDRNAIERELNVLRAAGIVPGPNGVALLDCANKTEAKLAAFDAPEARELDH